MSDLRYEEYTTKSIVVRGDTKKWTEELSTLRGKYNPNLRGGSGWIFPKTREKEVAQFIKTGKVGSSEKTTAEPKFRVKLDVKPEKNIGLVTALCNLKTSMRGLPYEKVLEVIRDLAAFAIEECGKKPEKLVRKPEPKDEPESDSDVEEESSSDSDSDDEQPVKRLLKGC